MSTKKVWLLKFVAGNPKMFTKVNTHDAVLRRGEAIELAERLAGNRWRVWVEHTGDPSRRIFESEEEIRHRTNAPDPEPEGNVLLGD